MYQDSECQSFSDEELMSLSQSQKDDEDYLPLTSSDSDSQESTEVIVRNYRSLFLTFLFVFEGI